MFTEVMRVLRSCRVPGQAVQLVKLRGRTPKDAVQSWRKAAGWSDGTTERLAVWIVYIGAVFQFWKQEGGPWPTAFDWSSGLEARGEDGVMQARNGHEIRFGAVSKYDLTRIDCTTGSAAMYPGGLLVSGMRRVSLRFEESFPENIVGRMESHRQESAAVNIGN